MESKLTLHFFILIALFLIQLPLEAQATQSGCSELRVIPAVSPACLQGSTGEVRLVVDQGLPPYRIKWSDGSAAMSRKLPAGNYSVKVTDALGCESGIEVTIPVSHSFQAVATVSHTSKTGKSNGLIDLNVSGGTPPYRYTWVSSQQGIIHSAVEGMSSVRKVPAGSYQILIYDSSGCYVEINAEVK